MKNYIKPSANVIELAVKERLSRTTVRPRKYNIKIGNNTDRTVENVNTDVYTSAGISVIELK